MLIGVMMFYVVGRVFLENARGALGETDGANARYDIAHIVVLEDPHSNRYTTN